MNEHDNIDVVKQIYAAFKTKDLPAILDLQTDDAEWTVAASPDEIPWAAPGTGKDGVAAFLKTLGEWLVAERFEIHEYVAGGGTVVALGSQEGHVPKTGKTYAFEFVHVWTVRDGRTASFRVYYDTSYVASVLR